MNRERLISALRAGVRVPADLSVVGHDDIDLSRFIGGGLTTLVTPKRAQCRAAVERLGRRLENPSAHRTPVEGSLPMRDRKSTRLNSSHVAISYAVFCVK